MRRPAAAAFLVGAGFVFGDFVRQVRPNDYLLRPLVAVAVVSVLIGLAAMWLKGWEVPAAVFAMVWLIRPSSGIAVGVAVGVAGLIVWRLWKGETLRVDAPVLAAAAVFAAVGFIPVVSFFQWSMPAQASEFWNGPPQYAVLLDGYPRADTLAEHDVNISTFVEDLKARGFTHYPEATSKVDGTMQTLSLLTVGDANEDWSTVEGQRTARNKWRLPDGWMTIAPPIGLATIPGAPTLNPGGFTHFEEVLLSRSLLAGVAGSWVWDSYRGELDRALTTLRSTDAPRVFAHIFAPHTPALYDADDPTPVLECWPWCHGTDPRPAALTVDERIDQLAGYVDWLNEELLDVVDQILEDRPDAQIVLFSDHGGRFDSEDREEWHRVFLAARGVNMTDAQPGDVFRRLDRRQSA